MRANSLFTTRTLLVGVVALVAPQSVVAQALTGVVLEDGRETPLAGATVALLSGNGERAAVAVADSDGRFRLEVPAGDYVLEASLLGYATTESPRFALDDDQDVALEVMLTPAPIALDGLEIEVAREASEALGSFGLTKSGLQERWIGRQDIERMVGAAGPRELIRHRNLAGVTLPHNPHVLCVRFVRGEGCALNVLNGTLVTHGQAVDLDPNSLHAIALLKPSEASLFYGERGNGGAVLIWTRTGRQ